MTELAVAELSRYECRSCGYIYEPERGQPDKGVMPGTAFTSLVADWRCPVCGARKSAFADIGTNQTAGFPENYRYGLGVNTLTPGQKNLLIFGGLAIGFLFLMSFYGLK
ncbi:rubredoxin-type Fe(Cys)4 protein [Gloeomargarita lithophora Alchichica-D10]|uniref:Rubredoxin n=1 Tax=Gloeomargarita lithophora Alchichica-D10 TaxID=1188229 RepID=A0A1J0AGA2_9CYAN|nr:rubredoxin [Gloeomargarita lithophora]APB34966.1 rubredoxin-type Fe(Cys)4 protein [Gloeomargarita lithophora Alchichica-D10]